MRLARIEFEGAAHEAVVAGEVVRLVGSDVELALADVRMLAPLEPASIRDFVTFEEHVEGIAGTVVPEWYVAPTFYFTNVAAVTGPFDEIAIPPGCSRFDFELEVACVIGKAGRDLTPEQAREHISHYTILNDWSARDIQFREMQVRLGPCKGKDSANTLGPWLVSADELDPYRTEDGRLDLDLRVWRNGELFGHDTLANMGWTFEEMVAYASRGTEVRPGDVLGSGTCGSGCIAELVGRGQDVPWLVPGDEITIEVQGIGRISNRIVAGMEPLPVGRARPTTRRPRPWNPREAPAREPPTTAGAGQPPSCELGLDAPRVGVHHEHEFSTRARRPRPCHTTQAGGKGQRVLGLLPRHPGPRDPMPNRTDHRHRRQLRGDSPSR